MMMGFAPLSVDDWNLRYILAKRGAALFWRSGPLVRPPAGYARVGLFPWKGGERHGYSAVFLTVSDAGGYCAGALGQRVVLVPGQI